MGQTGTKAGKRLRWLIVWTLFGSTVINYINRQTLSVLAPVLTRQLHLNHAQYSHIVSSFQIAYALTWLLGGVLLDELGTRMGLALAVVWWSVSSMLTAFAHSVFSFEFFRFLLGMGEGCSWPGATKAVAEWFPARERGLAVGIFDSGSSVGSVIAPPLVAGVAATVGWRYAFVASGVLGFAWLAVWLFVYYPLSSHRRLTAEERQLIEAGRDTAPTSPRSGAGRYLNLLRDTNVWGIVLGRSLSDPIWWFYVFWLPQYLSDARGFSLKQIGAFAWIPFLAADLGNFTGGFGSGFFIRRGVPVIRARKLVCILSAIPMLAGIPVTMVSNAHWALALISLATWGYASWSTMSLTFPSDLFPQDVVASVTGLAGLSAGVAGTMFTLAAGVVVDRFSYFPVFIAAGVIPLIATAATVILLRAPQGAAKSLGT
jgi:ACS family hexuronate transporter-like MFS transporter